MQKGWIPPKKIRALKTEESLAQVTKGEKRPIKGRHVATMPTATLTAHLPPEFEIQNHKSFKTMSLNNLRGQNDEVLLGWDKKSSSCIRPTPS